MLWPQHDTQQPCQALSLKQEEVNICITDMTFEEEKNKLEKLRRQFRHQPAHATEDLMCWANILSSE